MDRDGAKPSDIYYTPGSAIATLLDGDRAPPRWQPVTEPCAGRGDIVRALQQRGHQCVCAIEIREEERVALETLLHPVSITIGDALSTPGPLLSVVTNPPFSLGAEFWRWSAGARYGAFLVRLNVLGSNTWSRAWDRRRPTFLRTLKQRPSFSGRGTDAAEYGWLGWRDSDAPMDFVIV